MQKKIIVAVSIIVILVILYCMNKKKIDAFFSKLLSGKKEEGKEGDGQMSTPAPSDTSDTGVKDEGGNKLVSVTGKGGEDDGKVVKGYEFPTDINKNKFPMKIIVKPNGYMNGKKVGETTTVTKEDEFTVKFGQDNFAFYEALIFNSLRAEA